MDPAQDSQNVTKVMIVGDSISHGHEGDWTWRYRIWEWFLTEAIRVSFVGPYRGTVPADDPEPPRPPPLASEPARPPPFRTDGGYAMGISPEFLANSNHFSAWGRQINQAKHLIAEQVATHQPDILLVQLGFNDLGWCVTGPNDTLASMKTFVDEARSAKPDIKFAIANVPQRADLPGREDLPLNTDIYNALLARWIPGWSSPESPVALVRVCESYSSRGTTPNATYDGLHPNALGEYQLARAFSRTLISSFSLGRYELAIPDSIPARPLPTPINFKAVSAPSGIVVTWDQVYGAFGYDLRFRLRGSDSASSAAWQFTHLTYNRYDTRLCVKGQVWEYQVRTSGGDSETLKSPWSDVSLAVANPATAPGPGHIVVRATPTGLSIRWKPPPEDSFDGDIDRYGVITFDEDELESFPCVTGVKGERAEIRGLTPGHRYSIAVETWTTVGGGIPSAAGSVVVGRGVPKPPRFVRAVMVSDGEGVEVSWPGNPGVTWAAILVQEKGSRAGERSVHHRDTVVRGRDEGFSTEWMEKFVFNGFTKPPWTYQFGVAVGNGCDLSPWSELVIAEPLPAEATSLKEGDSVQIALRYS